MEPRNLLENENITQQRKFPCFQVAFYTFILVLIMISALVSIVSCLLHHKQASGSCWAHGFFNKSYTQKLEDAIKWEWKLEHCDGFVKKEHDQYLMIEKSGNYFVYAQINRKEAMKEPFTLMMFKEPDFILNKVVGPQTEDEKGTINFGRPFFLQKGDKLYCRANFDFHYILDGNWTYWGLYKI